MHRHEEVTVVKFLVEHDDIHKPPCEGAERETYTTTYNWQRNKETFVEELWRATGFNHRVVEHVGHEHYVKDVSLLGWFIIVDRLSDLLDFVEAHESVSLYIEGGQPVLVIN